MPAVPHHEEAFCVLRLLAPLCLGVKIKKKLHIYPGTPILGLPCSAPRCLFPLSPCAVLPLPLLWASSGHAVWGQLSCKLPSAFRVSSFVYAELNKFP